MARKTRSKIIPVLLVKGKKKKIFIRRKKNSCSTNGQKGEENIQREVPRHHGLKNKMVHSITVRSHSTRNKNWPDKIKKSGLKFGW